MRRDKKHVLEFHRMPVGGEEEPKGFKRQKDRQSRKWKEVTRRILPVVFDTHGPASCAAWRTPLGSSGYTAEVLLFRHGVMPGTPRPAEASYKLFPLPSSPKDVTCQKAVSRNTQIEGLAIISFAYLDALLFSSSPSPFDSFSSIAHPLGPLHLL
ncbi:hypothetical protein DL96DRAFT_190883 [Flagelloscypha sp. PMI_526]|nr:hypothetical protein DL96DRAFT_190883 [Flagelloscypha sp. PMI_526]